LFKAKESFSLRHWISYSIMIVCFLLISSFGFIFSSSGTAHAASKDTGWQLLLNGKPIMLYSHQEMKTPLEPPENLCITVHVTLRNTGAQSLQAQLGFFNNCGKGLVNTSWQYGTTIFCGPGEVIGPSGNSQHSIIVSKGQALSVFDETGHVTCLHNGVPQAWSAEGSGYVTGIVAGTSNAASGSDVEYITGF
jgi:hypothetical protein